MKRFLLVGLLIVGVLMVSMGIVGAQDAALKFIMVSHGSPQGNPFWTTVVNGMNDACKLLSADCTWLGDPSYSIEKMVGFWEDALAAKPTGIGTSSPDPESIRASVETARSQGIPVIIFNTADPNEGKDNALPVLFYIGANERQGGISNARRVFAQAKTDGKTIKKGVCYIQEEGHSGLIARCDGVKSVFDENGVPLDIIGVTNNDPTVIAGNLSDYFKANPDTNAAFMLGPNPSAGLDLYIKEAGLKPGDLYATTHDTSAEIYDMIKAGYLLQAIDQQPYLQGFETVMWLFLNSQYKLAPGGDIFTGPGVIDTTNVDDIVALTAAGKR
jgi:simple sugar transport system substrate-binding protein